MRTRQQDILRVLEEEGVKLHRLLYRLTLRADAAEELLQELVVRLMTAEGFATASNQAAFTYRIVIHLAMDWRRREKLRRVTRLVCEPVNPQESVLEQVVKAEELEEILGALDQLSESLREVFVMRLIEDRSYDEIAAMRGGTAHNARAICHQAVRRIRELLGVEVKHG